MSPDPQTQLPGRSPLPDGSDDRIPPGKQWAWSLHDHVYYFHTPGGRILYTPDRAFIDYVFGEEPFEQLDLDLA